MNRIKNPKWAGFLIGFGGMLVLGLTVIAIWGITRGASPAPTLVPSAMPISERVVPVQPTLSEPGTSLVLTANPATPTPQATPRNPGPTASSTPSQPVEYVVRAGDTLFAIALEYAVGIEALQQANSLSGETIVPGQVLIIPSGPVPTFTPHVENNAIIHTVSSGETLIGIAKIYSVTVDLIQTTNNLTAETIQPGWELRIPIAESKQPTPTARVSPIADASWQPSILTGDLEKNYPLSLAGERFTMHYQPDTPAARAPHQVFGLVESALNQIETILDVSLADPFDVYVAGSLFAPPDSALRGRSFSSQRRNFYLYDETGTPHERRYMIIHELTHLVAWNTLGNPASVMLHEGAAVYAGIEALEAAGFIPLTHFCAAYQQAGELPLLSGDRAYLGHIQDLDLYFSAGCFVQYLIEQYGMAKFKQLFATGDYPGIYGRTSGQLDAGWRKTLDATVDELAFAPEQLVSSTADVLAAYDRLFSDFAGTTAQLAAYRELDQARITLLQANFDSTKTHLTEFEKLLAQE